MLRMAAAALALLLASGAAAQAPPSAAPPDPAVPESVWALPPPSGRASTDLSLQTRHGGLVQEALEPKGPATRSRTGGGHARAGSYGDLLLPLGRGWAPYAGADLSIVLRDSDRGGDAIGLVVSPHVGLTWLVREYFSVDANVFMAWSMGEPYKANAQPDDYEHGLRLRLQLEF